MKYLLIAMLLLTSLQAQEWNPIKNEQMPAIPTPTNSRHILELTADETAKAQYYHDAVEAAKLALENFNNGIARKYLLKEFEMPSAASVCLGKGCTPQPLKPETEAERKKHMYWDYKDDWWINGFDYDEHYHFITPKIVEYPATFNKGTNSEAPFAFCPKGTGSCLSIDPGFNGSAIAPVPFSNSGGGLSLNECPLGHTCTWRDGQKVIY